MVAMRGTPVAGRPADVAAGDAPTVARHAGERKEVIVVPASSGAPMQGGSGEGASASSSPVPNLPKPMVERTETSAVEGESSHNPRGEKAASLSDDAPMELTQAVGPTAKSHAPVEEQEECLAPKRQRGRSATHVLAKSGVTRIHCWMSWLRWTQLQALDKVSIETQRTWLSLKNRKSFKN